MECSQKDLVWYGRYLDYKGIRYFDYSSSGFCFVMKGKKAAAKIISDSDKWDDNTKGILGVFVTESEDTSWKSFPEEPAKIIVLDKNENDCVLFESENEKTVCIRVLKLSEAAFGYAGFKNLEIEGELLKESHSPIGNKNLEIIGDSITCGYGVEGEWGKDVFTTKKERSDKSYSFLIAKKLNANLQCCSWSGIGITSNYVDPETINLPDTKWLMPALWPYTDKSLSLRLGIEPEVWDEKKFSPDVVLINLGTNDISWVRGKEDRRLNYVSGLRQLIETIHRRSPNAKICCCLGVMGQELCDSVFEAVNLFGQDFPKVPVKALKLEMQKEEDGIGTDWHPSRKTQSKIADFLETELKEWF